MKFRLSNFVSGVFIAVLAIVLGMAAVITFVEVATFLGNMHYTP